MGKTAIPERRRQPGDHLLLAQSDETARDGALRDALLPDVLGKTLEASPVLPGRDAAGHRFERSVVQGIATRSEREARELDLLAFAVADARPIDSDAPTPQRHRARGRAGSAGDALGVPLPQRTTQPLAVLLHHRVQNLTTRIDAQFEERVAGARQGSQERKRNFNERFR